MAENTEELYKKIGHMLMDLEMLVKDRENLLKEIQTLKDRIRDLEKQTAIDLTASDEAVKNG